MKKKKNKKHFTSNLNNSIITWNFILFIMFLCVITITSDHITKYKLEELNINMNKMTEAQLEYEDILTKILHNSSKKVILHKLHLHNIHMIDSVNHNIIINS